MTIADHQGFPDDPPERVLTVGAHPDDAEFGCGATVARWAAAGSDVTMCIVTDGSKGSWDVELSVEELASRRMAEQRAAGAVLGTSQLVHLGHTDGELVYSMELRLEIAQQIRLYRPNVVLSHDPWQRYQMHPDHRATGLATVDGIVSAREPRAMRDSGLEAHRPDAVLLWSADQPDHAEAVDDEWFDRKIAALLCHSSQSQTSMGNAQVGDAQRAAFVQRLRDWHRSEGASFDLASAETFKRLTP